MTYDLTSGRDLSQSAFSTGEPVAQPAAPTLALLPETALTELAAKFAAPAGPGLAPDLAMDLALQMVLHEIVEEASEATAATGAAIALSQDGELVCRASHGLTAPPLGSRLDLGVGLSGECLRTGQIQLCNDVQTDQRVDFEACSRLGVQSVVVLPLLRDGFIIGIFEVLSSNPSAFGESDVGMLQKIAERVLRNLERAGQPFLQPEVEASPNAEPVADPQLDHADDVDVKVKRRWTDVATWALAAVVVASAGWLTIQAVQRFTVQKAAVQEPTSRAKAVKRLNPSIGSSADNSAGAKSPSGLNPASAASSASQDGGERSSPRPAPRRTPDGGLRVFENGREVFRMPPSPAAIETTAQPGVVQASSVQPERVLELSPNAVQSGLLRRVEPEYPEEARLAGIQGSVVLEVHIRTDGSVEQVKVVSGEQVLANAAMQAVKQWQFKPHQVSGQPAEMQTTVTLNFRLPS